MKEEIEEWKKINGNGVTYTVKELIQALHIKTDKITQSMETKASKKMVLGMYGASTGLLGALTYYIFVILP